jgi:hypothetical protein
MQIFDDLVDVHAVHKVETAGGCLMGATRLVLDDPQPSAAMASAYQADLTCCHMISYGLVRSMRIAFPTSIMCMTVLCLGL